MGDGVSFPQRHMDEDEDSLLGGRSERWMEEGGVESTTTTTTTARNGANPYRKWSTTILFPKRQLNCLFFFSDVVNMDPAV